MESNKRKNLKHPKFNYKGPEDRREKRWGRGG